ncbi:MAG: hypothetical protein ABTD50_21425 [Polyangiaceae bacterium]|jgi:hypothetical protein
MNDPKRLLESGTEIERTLLSFGTAEHPGARARQAVIAALAAPTTAASAASSSAVGHSVSHSSAGANVLVVVVKYGGAMVLAAALAGGTAAVRSFGHTVQPAETAEGRRGPTLAGQNKIPYAVEPLGDVAAAAASVQPSSAGAAPTPDFLGIPVNPSPSNASHSIFESRSETSETRPAPRDRGTRDGELAPSAPERALQGLSGPASEAAPPATETTELAAEVGLLEQARSALANGNPDEALRHLHLHSIRIARPALEEEAQVLRAEALMKLGRAREATDLALSVQTAHPRTPYAKRLEALLHTPSDAPNP